MKLSEFFDCEDKWCRFAFALNKDGDCVSPSDDDAVRFCLWGAIGKLGLKNMCETVEILRLKYDSIIMLNDTHTYKEIMVILKENGL